MRWAARHKHLDLSFDQGRRLVFGYSGVDTTAQFAVANADRRVPQVDVVAKETFGPRSLTQIARDQGDGGVDLVADAGRRMGVAAQRSS